MKFSLSDSIAVLERTPGILVHWLRDLNEPWIQNNYGADSFSPFDVVGHLLHGERTDWMTRVEQILDHGEAVEFTPWDRYAMYNESRDKSINQLLEEFEAARQENLQRLSKRNITDNDLLKMGRHPRFGPVTLEQLLATWVSHDMNHLHQIAKCMAWQYREAIGPWHEYVTFIDR